MLGFKKPRLPKWRYQSTVITAALIGVAVVGIASSSSPASSLQTHATNASSERDHWPMDRWLRGWDADDFIAIFTGITGLIFLFQLFSMQRANKHFRVTERAYVKMSHESPGIEWSNQTGGGFQVSIRVKNHGKTPAKVTDVVTNLIVVDPGDLIDELPPSVTHTFPKETKAFLMAEDVIFSHRIHSIDDAERPLVDIGTKRMIIYGYVDYIDQFGDRYRGGYGRSYLPTATENNLVFPDTGPFNYDRKRALGEGRDSDGSSDLT